MTSELDIFVGNTTLIDEDVYRLWLDGYSVSEAVVLRVRSGILEQAGATAAMLQSHTMDRCRTSHVSACRLRAPPKLLHQLIFQIPPSGQALLIEGYYAFDEAFVREVLAKKKTAQGHQERPGWYQHQNRHHPQELLETVCQL